MLLALLCGLLPAGASAYGYEIGTLAQLEEFANAVNAGADFTGITVSLTDDIFINTGVVNGRGEIQYGYFRTWTPIGTEEHPFTGIFDGGDHVVTGIFIDNTELDYQGLFGVVSGARISNVTVKDGYINIRDHAGAVVGYARDGSVIDFCHNDGVQIHTANRAGGIVGWTDHSNVYNCSGNGYCYSTRCSGGIVGDVWSDGRIYNCYYSGDVEGPELCGGITGGSTRADIQNCISVGSVMGYMLAGGGGSRTIANSFALQNDFVNAGKSIGSGSSTTLTFSGPGAVLNGQVDYNGVLYSTALDALNAWVYDRQVSDDGVPYRTWRIKTLYPYLSGGVVSAYRTEEGSEADEWAVPELERAERMGLVPDVLRGEDLTKPINRLEFAAVAVKVYENLTGVPALPAVVNPFDDCSDLEVLKAYNVGITNGVSASSFEPRTLLNRETCATMLTRVFKRSTIPGWTLASDADFRLGYEMPSLFADDALISSWARESVYFMAANGIIRGVGGGMFAPRNTTSAEEAEYYANATREQALVIAVRMVENMG